MNSKIDKNFFVEALNKATKGKPGQRYDPQRDDPHVFPNGLPDLGGERQIVRLADLWRDVAIHRYPVLVGVAGVVRWNEVLLGVPRSERAWIVDLKFRAMVTHFVTGELEAIGRCSFHLMRRNWH
jgi:hypothetical protein